MSFYPAQARWDWMAATVPAFPIEIVNRLSETLTDRFTLTKGRGAKNYHETTRSLDADGNLLFTMYSGGPNGHPHVVASGRAAQPFTDALRSNYPEHRVSRMDSCVDSQGDFNTVAETLRDFAAYRDMYQAENSSGYGATLGRTFYIGSPKSRIRSRHYEKWPELLAKGEDPGDVPRDAIRHEVQHRPDKDAKDRAATITPQEAWGLSDWTHDLATKVVRFETIRQSFRYRQKTTFERAKAAMLHQYRGTLFEMLTRNGMSPEAVGRALFDELNGVVDDE